MTENEVKAVRFIENIKNHAMVTLDHIAKEEPNVSPLVYKGREEKADTILAMVEELKQYRAIGTPEECRAAMEMQTARNPIDRNMESGIFRKRKIFTCPRCGNACLEMMMNERQNTNYCWDCGQKLDWSDAE